MWQSDAVALFVARAQALLPAFQLTAANAPTIAAICHRLDGLPLAIELAAARIKLLAPEALLARLGSRLALLTGGARDVPARHQTLRATLDWSYRLLDRADQRLFARLAIFVGGYTLEAAETVCTAPSEQLSTVLEGLQTLLDNSMVQPVAGPADDRRFTMLEIIREYAGERLAACGEVEWLQAQHAAYYLALAEQAAPQLTGAAQVQWLGRLEHDHDNLRAALQWAMEHEDAETALRLATALARFWWLRGYLHEGRRWLEATLASAADDFPSLRGMALYWLGILAINQGDQARADAALARSVVVFETLHDSRGTALALNALGTVANRRGDYTRARAVYEESLALYRALGDGERVATLLNNLGFTLVLVGDLPAAHTHLTESWQIATAMDDTQGIAFVLTNLGWLALAEGDIETAQRMFTDSLTRFAALGDQRNTAEALEGLAEVAVARQAEREAAVLLGAASALRVGIGAPRPAYAEQRVAATMTRVQARLGHTALDVALRQGAALRYAEAVAYAVGTAAREEEREVGGLGS